MSYQDVYRAVNVEQMKKEAGMKKEALAGKGQLKQAIKQLFSILRTKQARKDFSDGFFNFYSWSKYPPTINRSLPERIGIALGQKHSDLGDKFITHRRKVQSPIYGLLHGPSGPFGMLDKIPKKFWTEEISQKNATKAADSVWRYIRDAYMPSTFKRKTPIDKWY